MHSSGYLKEMVRQYPAYYQSMGLGSPDFGCGSQSLEDNDPSFVANQLRDARQALEGGPHGSLHTPPIQTRGEDDSNLVQVTIASITKDRKSVV